MWPAWAPATTRGGACAPRRGPKGILAAVMDRRYRGKGVGWTELFSCQGFAYRKCRFA